MIFDENVFPGITTPLDPLVLPQTGVSLISPSYITPVPSPNPNASSTIPESSSSTSSSPATSNPSPSALDPLVSSTAAPSCSSSLDDQPAPRTRSIQEIMNFTPIVPTPPLVRSHPMITWSMTVCSRSSQSTCHPLPTSVTATLTSSEVEP
uniref:Uncharacterized protein n=1 Tax=Nelumbo nucifera TaxID=4432 RepID=A0A822ZKQ2_NELNU|nr:TPA_asm: hypothetical protein HUJ06_001816 [Nelumbo nucifera]